MWIDRRPVKKTNLKVEKIGSEAVLYNGDQKAIHVLNPTAQVIWELCDGNYTVEEIEQEIRKRFAVPEGVDVLGDIRQTLIVFAEKDILEQSLE